MKNRLVSMAIAAFAIVGVCARASAYDFLYTQPVTNRPIGWDSETTIRYYMDKRPLGRLSNDEARSLFQQAVEVWRNVKDARVPKFEFAGFIAESIGPDNSDRYLSSVPCLKKYRSLCAPLFQKRLQTVVLFDPDGALLRKIVCPDGQCFAGAFAGSFDGTAEKPSHIVQGMAIFGAVLDRTEESLSDSKEFIFRVMVHEVGHLLGLAHSPASQRVLGDDTTAQSALPAMFPSSFDDGSSAVNQMMSLLKPDDEAAISILYPRNDFLAKTGEISGTVYTSDGLPMPDMNVIATNRDTIPWKEYTSISGRTCPADSLPLHALYGGVCHRETGEVIGSGIFNLRGLPPGAYSLAYEPLRDEVFFTDLLESTIAVLDHRSIGDLIVVEPGKVISDLEISTMGHQEALPSPQ